MTFIKEIPLLAANDKLLTKSFATAFSAQILLALNFSNNAIYPLFILHFGGDAATIGLFMAVYQVSAVLSRPLVGSLIDRWGAKPVLMLGAALLGLAPLGLWLQFDMGLSPLAWILRAIQGFGYGAHFTAYFTLAAKAAPEGRRNETVAKYGMAGFFGHFVGPIIGEMISRNYGLEAFFQAMAVVAFVGFIFEIFITLPKDDNGERKAKLDFRGMLVLLKALNMRIVFIMAILHSISFSVLSAFIAPVSESRGIEGFGLYYTGFSAAGIVLRLTISHWPDKFGLRRVLIPAFALYAIGLLIMAVSPNLPTLIIAGVFCGAAHGFTFPIITTLGYNLSPSKYSGSSVALVTGMMDVGATITAISLGWLATVTGTLNVIFPTAAIAPVIAIVILAWDVVRNPEKIRQFLHIKNHGK